MVTRRLGGTAVSAPAAATAMPRVGSVTGSRAVAVTMTSSGVPGSRIESVTTSLLLAGLAVRRRPRVRAAVLGVRGGQQPGRLIALRLTCLPFLGLERAAGVDQGEAEGCVNSL